MDNRKSNNFPNGGYYYNNNQSNNKYDNVFNSYNNGSNNRGNFNRQKPKKNYGKIIAKILMIIFILAIIGGLGFGGYYLVNKYIINREVVEVELVNRSLELEVGQTKKIGYNLKGSDDVKLITFESTDTNVATVDEVGNVTAVNAGLATILLKYKSKGGKNSVACTIKVNAAPTPTPIPAESPTPVATNKTYEELLKEQQNNTRNNYSKSSKEQADAAIKKAQEEGRKKAEEAAKKMAEEAAKKAQQKNGG